jgi:hypothetical protein
MADHVGADSLVLLRFGEVVQVVMKFGDQYCKTSFVQPKYGSTGEVLSHLFKIRDEFFLLGMHSITQEEGIKLIEKIDSLDQLVTVR